METDKGGGKININKERDRNQAKIDFNFFVKPLLLQHSCNAHQVENMLYKEDYSAMSRCYEAKAHLDKLVQFFDDACDYVL